MMAIEGAVVTIDAMGCQRDIAAKIIAKKADYILALPRSPPTKPSTPITVASRRENTRSFTMSNGCRRGTTGPH